MYSLPDEPSIANALRTGYPDDEKTPICPVCGEECETIFKDRYGQIVGCSECIEQFDPWELYEEGLLDE